MYTVKMAHLALLEDLARAELRRERIFRDREDFLAHDDDWLISQFCLPRTVLPDLCDTLALALQRGSRRNHALPVPLQVPHEVL